jgi:hypothetical protein
MNEIKISLNQESEHFLQLREKKEVSAVSVLVITGTNTTSKLNPANQAAKLMLLSLLAKYD